MGLKPGQRVYPAARFSRQAEMREVAAWLRVHGYSCAPAWLGEGHQMPRKADQTSNAQWATFAQDDVRDLAQADIVICFTEPEGTPSTRGGRHVELGMALAMQKRVIVVGPRENVFTWLPEVEHYHGWVACQAALWSWQWQERL